MSANAAALIPVVLVAVGFAIFCFVDVVRADEVRLLPRWAWAVISLISVPLGGIVYLIRTTPDCCGTPRASASAGGGSGSRLSR